ncbi:hypothetical protein FC65_GL000648 [Ligilactobacillus acidipiscis DSM 15836]|uniref:Restriction endonuclease type IV Mrr domain-containing protein n=1 Tax=Ligilactobacillus acidipiscis DSM 15836 TaxID=1423716 RepID=A0ABR5PN77_9LACO|nr:restriction endonuclease [Ligilactobacillus acidipiscis]KRM30313.1 hypothetical protein FC65_GL000648 [Ligilactobacillus acidipiscis DSM 15836]GAW63398.1 hypothetical protein Lacidipiscis_00581 [Ligilactobacillus acidipiscis]GEN19607.1 hypothetical protein LAC02_28880 [Ligilactobacillus acidipiscis]
MKEEKLEPREFIQELMNILNTDNDKNVLVRGYFNQDKLTATLNAIEASNLNKCVFVTGNVSEVPRLFNGSLKIGFKKVKLNQNYKIGSLNLEFIKRNQFIEENFAFDKDISIFFPVEGILFDDDETKKFITKLKHSKAKKNILVTTNDYSDKAKKLYSQVDRVLILDTSKLNSKNIETMKTLTKNLKKQGGLPY